MDVNGKARAAAAVAAAGRCVSCGQDASAAQTDEHGRNASRQQAQGEEQRNSSHGQTGSMAPCVALMTTVQLEVVDPAMVPDSHLEVAFVHQT